MENPNLTMTLKSKMFDELQAKLGIVETITDSEGRTAFHFTANVFFVRDNQTGNAGNCYIE